MSDSTTQPVRYAIRPDRQGYSVFDVWTGQTLLLAMDPQTGLSKEDAEHTAQLFNDHATRGDRSVRQ